LAALSTADDNDGRRDGSSFGPAAWPTAQALMNLIKSIFAAHLTRSDLPGAVSADALCHPIDELWPMSTHFVCGR